MIVSKETAVLLKEAGYDVPSRQYYDMGKKNAQNTQENNPINWNKHDELYSAPTLHEAADWERRNGVHVYTEPVWDGSKCWIGVVVILALFRRIDTDKFPTHDSAYEAGIVHGLKYIQ